MVTVNLSRTVAATDNSSSPVLIRLRCYLISYLQNYTDTLFRCWIDMPCGHTSTPMTLSSTMLSIRRHAHSARISFIWTTSCADDVSTFLVQITSPASTDYVLPRLRTKFGERAFCYAGPSAWNRLLEDIRAESDIANFRKLLITHYFNSTFKGAVPRKLQIQKENTY